MQKPTLEKRNDADLSQAVGSIKSREQYNALDIKTRNYTCHTNRILPARDLEGPLHPEGLVKSGMVWKLNCAQALVKVCE